MIKGKSIGHIIIARNGKVHDRVLTYYTRCGTPFGDEAEETTLPITCNKCKSGRKS